MKHTHHEYPAGRSDAEWKELLTPFEYHVLREKGTERPFSGEFNGEKRAGKYLCKACGQELFLAHAKFDSACGWPSYFKPVSPDAVEEHSDTSHSMVRTEITCSRCGSHLGHVFNDGPPPTGLRYCINSVCLRFEPEEDEKS